jgi:hypothetical protein
MNIVQVGSCTAIELVGDSTNSSNENIFLAREQNESRFKSYFGGATESDVTGNHVTGNDVIGSHVTGSDRVRTRNRSPRFFLTIVVVQNVSLRMTGSSMATGFDVTEVGNFPLLESQKTIERDSSQKMIRLYDPDVLESTQWHFRSRMRAPIFSRGSSTDDA